MVEYESYQSTSYRWLPKVPSHWHKKSIRQITSVLSERCGNRDYRLLSVYREYGVIPKDSCDDNHNKESLDLSNYKVVHIGDLVLNKMKMWQGSLGVSQYEGIVSPAYIICKVLDKDINLDYLHLLLRSARFKSYYNQYSYGIRVGQWDMHYEDFKNLKVYMPPRAEQDQIVRFLDWKVSAINKLIGIRRKEIQELEEMKRSKIGAIVMGQSRMQQKKSDITWVDTIPINWEEKPLIQYAYERCIKNVGMVEDNLLSLSYGKVIDKDINTTDGLLPASFEGYQIVEPGNIILRLTDLQNDHKSLRTGLVTRRGIITSAYTCLETRDDILPEYLQLELHVADLCKVFYGMGGGVRQSIGFKDIKRMIIAIPPLSEQHEILDLIHDIDAPIDKQKEQYLKIINELEELKKVIISE
ncbi:MAG: restriction endonuclease subunit S [Lachnospiraceae bacterium]|jgi:type I restriction enzyme S subunit|nr:restriction endonuclease subunit S [Lachnospiraceae bacterium]MCH4108742.1 restriction endonuclease subunit S [Lachnospiraceae bacterium]